MVDETVVQANKPVKAVYHSPEFLRLLDVPEIHEKLLAIGLEGMMRALPRHANVPLCAEFPATYQQGIEIGYVTNPRKGKECLLSSQSNL